MVYNAKKIILEYLTSVIIKKSEDEQIHVSSDSLEKFKITCTDGKLSICGIATSESTYSVSGVSIKRSRHGGISVTNVSGKDVSIINNQVWIDGKQVDQKDIPPPPPPVTISIPNQLVCTIRYCDDVQMQNHEFKELMITLVEQNIVSAGEITCKDDIRLLCSGQSSSKIDALISNGEMILTISGMSDMSITALHTSSTRIKSTGQSVCKITKLHTKKLETETSGMSSCKIKEADIASAQLQTSGQDSCKVEGLLTQVVANASGISSCKFSMPRNQPFITKSGMATCKAI